MKYEKITKLAKILKNIFMGFILVEVIGLVFLGFPITILILRGEAGPYLVDVFAKILQQSITPIDVKLILGSFTLLLLATLILSVDIKNLLKLIEKNATPFQKDITQQLRKVIKWSLIVALLPVWKVWDISSLLYNLIFIALLYLLLLIFEYGISLQAEVDETL